MFLQKRKKQKKILLQKTIKIDPEKSGFSFMFKFPYEPIIGNLPLKGRIILGPMAGITNLPYREFMKPFGVSLSVSEMISDCGIMYGNEKTKEYYRSSPSDTPFALQLFGAQLSSSLKAIEILEKEATYDVLDLNFGCPVPKVTKTGAGSSWLLKEEELFHYVLEITKHSHKPVTAKIRLGWDKEHQNAEKVCFLLAKAGVQMVTIHARTRAQGYQGRADFSSLYGLGYRLPIPLCISGDIQDLSSIETMEKVGASFLMVARFGVGNPLLIKQLDCALKGKEIVIKQNLDEQISFALTYYQLLKEKMGEQTAFSLAKGILPKFFRFFEGGKKIRQSIVLSKDKNELEEHLIQMKNGDISSLD